MPDSSINNKRIAKNTLFLYIRMLVLMAISLYTSRVLLATLGVDDYGLYHVVGGVVAMLAFLNTSMAGATQRFLNIELGKNDTKQLLAVFNTSRVIHFIIAIVIFALSETIGLWFLNNHMTIDKERLYAANWVYQFSILSFLTTILSVPYNAAIISHEKMSAFAYISVVEAVLKLLIVFVLDLTRTDKLILYSLLMALVSILIRLLYSWYCTKHFSECKNFSFAFDKSIMGKMASYSSWTVVGALGSISHTQGVAIVINMFFGVAVNAAQGIANQVIHVVNQFVTNFMIALNPQIVKSYAVGDLKSMHILIKRGSRMGFCLVTLLALPIIIEAPAILNLWLKEVPEYTVIFVRLILLTSIFNSFSSPLAKAKGATGNIRNYQIVLTTLGLCHVPLAWICFELGYPPYSAMIVYLILVIIMQSCRIYMTCHSISMRTTDFVSEVVIRCTSILVLSSLAPLLLIVSIPQSLTRCILTIFSTLISSAIFIYFVGALKNEREFIICYIKNRIKK